MVGSRNEAPGRVPVHTYATTFSVTSVSVTYGGDCISRAPTEVRGARTVFASRATSSGQWKPTDADLNGVAGEWYSEEAQSRISITVENGKAFLTLRPVIRFQLDPAYKDAFSGDGYIMWFKRDKSGNATELHVGGSRMRDMLFVRGH